MINIEHIQLHDKFTIHRGTIVWHVDVMDWDEMLMAECEVETDMRNEYCHVITKAAWEHLLQLESTPPRVASDKKTPWGIQIAFIERQKND